MSDPADSSTKGAIRFTMTAPLRRVLVAHARDCFQSPPWLAAHWRSFGFRFEPDFDAACRESDQFIRILDDFGAQVEVLDPELCAGMDSLYVHDPVVACGTGFLLGRMGKPARRPETEAMMTKLDRLGMRPEAIENESALLEGGDVVWLRPELPAVGIGFRTNDAGADALEAFCGDSIEELVRVPLPWNEGPSDVLHLMSLVSPLSDDCLLVYSRLMPVFFRQRLEREGFRLLEVPPAEYDSLGGNVLALDNSTCLVEKGNTRTTEMLSSEGFDVLTYNGRNISLAGSGGPTCLTRPLVRG